MGFPNLHTVKLNILQSYVETASRKTFENREFPQITSVILSFQAYPLISSCPNLKSLQLIGRNNGHTVWSKYIKPSQAIQNLVVDIGRFDFEGEYKTDSLINARANNAIRAIPITSASCQCYTS